MLRPEAPGGGMNARVGVLHPEVVLVRPSVIVDLKEQYYNNKGEVEVEVAQMRCDPQLNTRQTD